MDGQTRETTRIGRHGRLIAVVLFLVALFAAAELSGLRDHFGLAFLRQRLDEHLAGGLAIFTLLFVLGNLIQIPGWIFLAAAVLALGRGWGGIATYLAANVSCAFTFFAIRWMGGDALRRLKGHIATRLLGELHAHPIRSIVLLRTLFQTLPALNYALALSGMSFGTYMAGTLLGLPLPIAAYCVFFDYLATFVHA